MENGRGSCRAIGAEDRARRNERERYGKKRERERGGEEEREKRAERGLKATQGGFVVRRLSGHECGTSPFVTRASLYDP